MSTYLPDEYGIAPFRRVPAAGHREDASFAEAAADGVLIGNVEYCESYLQHWRFEPVDATVRPGN